MNVKQGVLALRTPCSNVTFLSINRIDQNLAIDDKKVFP